MNEYKIKIQLLSDTLLGSGEGLGANIDMDIVFDELGVPYIPARRLKGVLKDAVQDTIEMLQQANIMFSSFDNSEEIFGKHGSATSAEIYFSNLYLTEYEQAKEWLKYLTEDEKFDNFFSNEIYTDFFTSIRHQTQIENGVTKEHSLRTFRVLKSGFEFEGKIRADEEKVEIISLACSNLRNIGMMRNRGFGEVEVRLFDNNNNDLTKKAIEKLEALCKN